MKMGFWFAAFTLVAAALATAQDAVRVTVEVENLKGRSVIKSVKSAISKVDGVKECSVSGKKITILVDEEDELRLSDVEATLKGMKGAKGKDLVVLRDKIRLLGKLELDTQGNPVEVQRILGTFRKLKNLKLEEGNTFSMDAASGGVTIADITKLVKKEVEGEKDWLVDVIWFGPPKKKDTPSKKPGG